MSNRDITGTIRKLISDIEDLLAECRNRDISVSLMANYTDSSIYPPRKIDIHISELAEFVVTASKTEHL